MKTPQLFMFVILIAIGLTLFLGINYKNYLSAVNNNLEENAESIYVDKGPSFPLDHYPPTEREKQQMHNLALGNLLVTTFNEVYDNDESMPFTFNAILIKESEEDYEKLKSVEVKITETSDDGISVDSLIELRYFIIGSFDYNDKKGAYFSIINQLGEMLYEETI